MNGPALIEWVLSGLWLALLAVVPLLVVGALAGAGAGALAGALGIQDGALARVARSLAVVGAMALLLGVFGSRGREFARESWTRMARVDGPVSEVEDSKDAAP